MTKRARACRMEALCILNDDQSSGGYSSRRRKVRRIPVDGSAIWTQILLGKSRWTPSWQAPPATRQSAERTCIAHTLADAGTFSIRRCPSLLPLGPFCAFLRAGGVESQLPVTMCLGIYSEGAPRPADDTQKTPTRDAMESNKRGDEKTRRRRGCEHGLYPLPVDGDGNSAPGMGLSPGRPGTKAHKGAHCHVQRPPSRVVGGGCGTNGLVVGRRSSP